MIAHPLLTLFLHPLPTLGSTYFLTFIVDPTSTSTLYYFVDNAFLHPTARQATTNITHNHNAFSTSLVWGSINHVYQYFQDLSSFYFTPQIDFSSISVHSITEHAYKLCSLLIFLCISNCLSCAQSCFPIPAAHLFCTKLKSAGRLDTAAMHGARLRIPISLFFIEFNERPFSRLMISSWLQINSRSLTVEKLLHCLFFIAIISVSVRQSLFPTLPPTPLVFRQPVILTKFPPLDAELIYFVLQFTGLQCSRTTFLFPFSEQLAILFQTYLVLITELVLTWLLQSMSFESYEIVPYRHFASLSLK